MKHVIILFLAINLFACESPELDLTPYPAPSNPNLKHFGFTLIDVGFDDPKDREKKTNYIDEVADFSNLADLLVISPEDTLLSRLKLMAAQEVKGMLHLNEIFFEIVGNDSELKSGTQYDLRADYQARWDQFVSVNQLDQHTDLLQAFYIGEEPTWNDIDSAELKAACDYVKLTVPEVPIMLVEAFPVLADLVVPNSVDWFGFDHYFIMDPQQDSSFQAELAIIKSKRQPHQSLVLIMDTHHFTIGHGLQGIKKDEMDQVAKNYYDLANTETDVTALIGYHWPSGFELRGVTGARDMPEHVQLEYRKIGEAITRK